MGLCDIQESQGHVTEECPTVCTVKEIFNEQVVVVGMIIRFNQGMFRPQQRYFPFSNMYNPSWWDHPNLSWNYPSNVYNNMLEYQLKENYHRQNMQPQHS